MEASSDCRSCLSLTHSSCTVIWWLLPIQRGLRDGGGALESMLVDEKAEFLAPDQVARVRPPAPPLWTANLRSWLKVREARWKQWEGSARAVLNTGRGWV